MEREGGEGEGREEDERRVRKVRARGGNADEGDTQCNQNVMKYHLICQLQSSMRLTQTYSQTPHLLGELCCCHGDCVQHGGGVGVEERHPIPNIIRQLNVAPIGQHGGTVVHLEAVSCSSKVTQIILYGRVVHLWNGQ